ncbi:MAG: hypothetical protein V4694_06585 [Pseudomonadota bacterium]
MKTPISAPKTNSTSSQQAPSEKKQNLEIAEQLHQEAINVVSDPSEFYNHYVLNFVIDVAIAENEQARLIPLDDDHNFAANLPVNLWAFQQSEQAHAVIPIRPVGNQGAKAREHFAGIYISKNDEGYSAAYIDPIGSGDVNDIPLNIRNSLWEVLGIAPDKIISTTNKIQHRTSSILEEDGIEYLTNVHCGAFTGFILSGLALGNIMIEGNRLQIITTEGWQDIPDLNEEQSNSFGTEIREQNLNLLTGQQTAFPEVIIEELLDPELQNNIADITAGIDNLAKKVADRDSQEFYQLKRSDSNMSQYSDLVEEMLNDHLDPRFESKQREYDVIDVIISNPQIVKIDSDIKALESKNRSLGQLAKHGSVTPEQKTQQQKANRQQKAQLTAFKDTLPQEKERNYEGEDATKRMHIFRGKNMNNVILDPLTGTERTRTKKEKEDYVTKKFAGKAIYSDGTDTVRNDPQRFDYAEKVTRGYIRGIKDGSQNKALFGAGTSYTSAVGHLMRITQLKGNPVAAATKFPWVAAEYMIGQMGGAAGGNRDTAFGYQKDGKPVNRVLGNGFAMSLSLADYKSLRDSNDLIDVNLDIPGRGMECNRMIEEITFVSKIEGKFVKGSLPMVLPRLDRNWGDMSREKHAQYRRVFGFDKSHYENFQTLLQTEGAYPLGSLTEFLIQHHGNLLREIAINSDRKEGYQGRFVATQDSSEKGGYHGDLEDLNLYGKKLTSRDARTGSSIKSSPYLTREIPPATPDKSAQNLHERIVTSVQTPFASDAKVELSIAKQDLETADQQQHSTARILFDSPEKGKQRTTTQDSGPLEKMSDLESALPASAPPKSVAGKTLGIKLVDSKTKSQSSIHHK